MIILDGSSLSFRFSEVHRHAKTEISFQRTLRIPDDGKQYPLPPGLGRFPLQHMEDFANRVPNEWSERGGVIMPLYQAEAMWIAFTRDSERYPCAIKIASGKINAVSGKPWKPELDGTDHDYMVVPEQPWLDGFCVAKDVIRQFVAMPLGAGYSIEEQITGKAEHGGLQIHVYPMKKERYEPIMRAREEEAKRQREFERNHGGRVYCMSRSMSASASLSPERSAGRVPARAMALAAGGRMKQQIYKDPYGLDSWDQTVSSRCFVTLVDAVQWREITGSAPPTRAPTAADYSKAGLPWFDYYAADLETLAGAAPLALAKSIAEVAAEKGEQVLGADGDVDPSPVVALGGGKLPRVQQPRTVRESLIPGRT